MLALILKILLSAAMITLVTWIVRRDTQLAGFVMALPISTMIALVLTQAEYRDPATSTALAKSIFFATPLSLLFFVPFLLAEQLRLSFWLQYASGVALLGLGYYLHRVITGLL